LRGLRPLNSADGLIDNVNGSHPRERDADVAMPRAQCSP
jgi:hypothetical protein